MTTLPPPHNAVNRQIHAHPQCRLDDLAAVSRVDTLRRRIPRAHHAGLHPDVHPRHPTTQGHAGRDLPPPAHSLIPKVRARLRCRKRLQKYHLRMRSDVRHLSDVTSCRLFMARPRAASISWMAESQRPYIADDWTFPQAFLAVAVTYALSGLGLSNLYTRGLWTVALSRGRAELWTQVRLCRWVPIWHLRLNDLQHAAHSLASGYININIALSTTEAWTKG